MQAIDPWRNRHVHFLLVEDDEALAQMYTTRLEAVGFAVEHVANGEDALSTASLMLMRCSYSLIARCSGGSAALRQV